MRKELKKLLALVCCAALTCLAVTGCAGNQEKRTIRIGHNQSTNHPTHIALTAFQDYINDKLGDKYVVEGAAKTLGAGLPKQQTLQGGCLHILEYKANDTKQYA